VNRYALAISRRALVVGASASFTAGTLGAQESAAGKIDSMRGDAFAERASARRPLQPAADVFVGDLVETNAGSALSMHLGKATIVKLGALAKFRIDSFIVDTGGTLELDQGAMVIDRNDDAKKERLQLRSPFGLIAVRGTLFFAGPSNDVFGVFVARGAVAVTGGGRTVNLRAGEGTDIATRGAAPSAPHAWAPDRVAAAFRTAG
jgi:hypothetical protein